MQTILVDRTCALLRRSTPSQHMQTMGMCKSLVFLRGFTLVIKGCSSIMPAPLHCKKVKCLICQTNLFVRVKPFEKTEREPRGSILRFANESVGCHFSYYEVEVTHR